jgi:Icc-related predicted phosphoesterase
MRLSRRGKTSEDGLGLCFVTDIHGSDRCFRKFLNAAKFYDVQYLILGGDITGKTIVPIERTPTGWQCAYSDHEYVDLTEQELRELEQLVRDNGQYPLVGERDELVASLSEERAEETFKEVVLDSIRRWMGLADERLSGTGVRCFVTPGNDDFYEIDPTLRSSEVVEFVEGESVDLDGPYEMITTGYSNLTPWNTPRELPEEQLSARIEAMFQKVDNAEHLIAVLHAPPYDTQLDQAPLVDEELRVKTAGGGVAVGPVGSTAVRDFIVERQPLLSLHGHVHESQAAQRLGRTLCLNPGSEYTAGTLSCAVVRLDGKRVPEFQFTKG